MSIIWTSSTLSGIGDRLVDLVIMSSYAKIKNKILKFNYKTQPFNGGTNQEKLRPEFRKYDYTIDNVKKYLTFPSNVQIYDENIDIEYTNNDEYFTHYLGGVFSPITFYVNFVKDLCTLDKFINIYYEQAYQFKFNFNLPLNEYKDYVTVHLRRTDKVSNYTNEHHGIRNEDLNELDNITESIIDKLINKGYTKIYFCSDDENTLNKYIKKYENIINILNNKFLFDNDIETLLDKKIKRVYLDLYIMSQSKYIILSQKHSSFSLFSSMINKSTLIYIYDDIITNTGYNTLQNIIKYDKDF